MERIHTCTVFNCQLPSHHFFAHHSPPYQWWSLLCWCYFFYACMKRKNRDAMMWPSYIHGIERHFWSVFLQCNAVSGNVEFHEHHFFLRHTAPGKQSVIRAMTRLWSLSLVLIFKHSIDITRSSKWGMIPILRSLIPMDLLFQLTQILVDAQDWWQLQIAWPYVLHGQEPEVRTWFFRSFWDDGYSGCHLPSFRPTYFDQDSERRARCKDLNSWYWENLWIPSCHKWKAS